jgi:hypothetical protein
MLGVSHLRRQLFPFVLLTNVWVIGCGGHTQLGGDTKLLSVTPQADEAVVELDPAKQKAIWDAEHITFELERRFGPPLLQAIRAQDQEQLTRLFRENFSGSFTEPSETQERANGFVTETVSTYDSPAGTLLDAEQMSARLLNTTESLSTIERARFRVLKIRKSDLIGRWEIRVMLTFVGQQANSQETLIESEHQLVVTIGEEEEIGREPLVEQWRVESLTQRWSTRRLMQEITAQIGFDRLPLKDNWKVTTSQASQFGFQFAAEDFDRDGYIDVAVAGYNGQTMLLRSRQGRSFIDVSRQMGIGPRIAARNSLAAWIDFDNDGYPDLLLGEALFHNEKGKHFTEVTQQSGLYFDFECMGAVTADYDGDGLLDLYVLYQRDQKTETPVKETWIDESQSGKANVLWRNVGGGRFIDVTSVANVGGGRRFSHAASWFFYDQDRWPDLYIANDFGRNVVLRNKGDGSFVDVSAESAASDFATSMGVATGDIDNDGFTDIYVANMYSKMGRRIIDQVSEADYPTGIYQQIKGSCAGNRLYSKHSVAGPYREHSESMGVYAVGWAYAPVMADLDNDGWLDIYATTGFMSFDRQKPDG